MSALRVVERVERAARRLLDKDAHVVLAVSGGSDSMSLLGAVARVRDRHHRIAVAHFNHGTGTWADKAAAVVAQAAWERRLVLFQERAEMAEASEEGWRRARWEFLHRVSEIASSPIATAHTSDDQLETVTMRILRGAGARGLAGLRAESAVLRPFLDLSRRDLRCYAECQGLVFVDDPSNANRAFLRSRVRHDLLPALRLVSTDLAHDLHALSKRAAQLRLDVETLASNLSRRDSAGAVVVPRSSLESLNEDELALLWPALLARAGCVADRRSIARLSRESRHVRAGTILPLPRGFQMLARRGDLVVRRVPEAVLGLHDLSPTGVTRVGQWRFYPLDVTTISRSDLALDLWSASFPATAMLRVRAWQSGDRLRTVAGGAGRRVTRCFEDARISGLERREWPVVTEEDEVVWVPGVRRTPAATERSGGPYVVYHCERDTRRSETRGKGRQAHRVHGRGTGCSRKGAGS